MRCMACGADMILVKVIADETMPVPGFQRHAYMCSLCHDTEQRLFFDKHAQERELEIVPAPVETASTELITLARKRPLLPLATTAEKQATFASM
jgi:hypothetical protein